MYRPYLSDSFMPGQSIGTLVHIVFAGNKPAAMAKMKEMASFGFNRQMQEVSRALSLGPNNALCNSLFSEEVWPTLLARLSQVIYQADSSLDEL